MSDGVRNKDEAKGRVKEAAGAIAGDRQLKREGKVDRASGRAKGGVGRLTDKVKEALRRD